MEPRFCLEGPGMFDLVSVTSGEVSTLALLARGDQHMVEASSQQAAKRPPLEQAALFWRPVFITQDSWHGTLGSGVDAHQRRPHLHAADGAPAFRGGTSSFVWHLETCEAMFFFFG